MRFLLLAVLGVLLGCDPNEKPQPRPTTITFTIQNASRAWRLFRLSAQAPTTSEVLSPTEIPMGQELTAPVVAAVEGEQQLFRFEAIAHYGSTLAQVEVPVSAHAGGTHCSISYVEWVPGNNGLPRVDVNCSPQSTMLAECAGDAGAPGNVDIELANTTNAVQRFVPVVTVQRANETARWALGTIEVPALSSVQYSSVVCAPRDSRLSVDVTLLTDDPRRTSGQGYSVFMLWDRKHCTITTTGQPHPGGVSIKC